MNLLFFSCELNNRFTWGSFRYVTISLAETKLNLIQNSGGEKKIEPVHYFSQEIKVTNTSDNEDKDVESLELLYPESM